MSFNIDTRPHIAWPVIVVKPKDGGGHAEAGKFTAHFRRLSQDELNELKERRKAQIMAAQKLARSLDADSGEVDLSGLPSFDEGREMMRDYLLGWEKIGQEGSDFEFSEENRELLLSDPDVVDGLVTAFVELYFGDKKGQTGKTKN